MAGDAARALDAGPAPAAHCLSTLHCHTGQRRTRMQEWHKPEVAEEQVGLEVTSYASAELD
jgi:coenzyme PQQ precursor peptide PqqA